MDAGCSGPLLTQAAVALDVAAGVHVGGVLGVGEVEERGGIVVTRKTKWRGQEGFVGGEGTGEDDNGTYLVQHCNLAVAAHFPHLLEKVQTTRVDEGALDVKATHIVRATRRRTFKLASELAEIIKSTSSQMAMSLTQSVWRS